MIKNNQGIYRIVNKENGLSYIGRTTDFNKRFKEHADALKNNKHSNLKLQEDFNKIGQNSFGSQILEVLEDMRDSKEKEWKYINEFKDTGVYNTGNPLHEAHPVLDRATTIFDSIPKEAISEYSYSEIKERTLSRSKGFIKDMQNTSLEKDGVRYWSFYHLFHEIHSQLFFYSTDARFLLALKEVLEDEGFHVVSATANSKKMSHFIHSDYKEYIILKNETMNGIRYSFKKTLEIHEKVKMEKERRSNENKKEREKRKDEIIAEQRKEIESLKKKLKKEKAKNK